MKIQLIYFEGCPHVAATRAALRDALATTAHVVEEIDTGRADAPDWARRWGSPTVLIDGVDVAGLAPSDSACCRLYPTGAPTVAQITARLAASDPA